MFIIPITLAIGLYNSLYYRTSGDRMKITTPLKRLFEASLKLNELPHDWVNALYLLSIKKAKSQNYATIWPISLTSILCKIMEQFIRDYIIQQFLHSDLF